MSRRVWYFDWLRGAATLAVVALHMFNKMLTDHSVAELGVGLVLTWTELQIALTRWAVPVFLMISGALLLDPDRQPTWRKMGTYIARIVAVLLIFCPVYACMSARTISLTAIASGLVAAVCETSWDHLWYLYALIGLYVLTPLFAPYVRSVSRETERATLLVLGVTTLVLPTINLATGASITTIAWLVSPAFYYLLGSYAHRHLCLDRRLCLLGAIGLGVCLVAAAWCVCAWSWYPQWVVSSRNPFIACWSLLIFVAAKEYLDVRKPPAFLARVSDLSLAIYLLHPLVIVALYRRFWWMPYETLPPVAFELAVLAIAYGTTIPTAMMLKRVPGLGRLL